MNIEERLDAKTDKTDECWIWTGCRTKSGYGVMRAFKRQEYVHRLSYSLRVEPIPPGMMVDHKCHNKACVNPAHLRLSTPGENTRNAITPVDNTSGFKGVTPEKRCPGRWQARITVNYKQFHLGMFGTPEEAHNAYCEAADRLHGEFANHG